MLNRTLTPYPWVSKKSLEPTIDIESTSSSMTSESSNGHTDLEEHVLTVVKSDAFLVDWYGPRDAGNPQNWSMTRKVLISISLALYALITTFASSVFGAASPVMAREFGVPLSSMIFGCSSMFMLGFATGPTVFGPLSEACGRRRPIIAGYLMFAVLQLPVLNAQSATTVYALRYAQGFFGAAPSSILMGVLADIWTPKQRGFAMPCVGSFLAVGPCLGPLIANTLVNSSAGWRGIPQVTAIAAFAVAAVTIPVMSETYPPLILAQRARRLRISTQNWAIRAKAEEQTVNLADFAERYMLRPARMLALEPILALMTLYISLSFGLLYNFFLAYPASFTGERGWDATSASLPLLALMIGIILAGAICSFTVNSRLSPNLAQGRPQECRMILMTLGAVLLPGGMLMFAWASSFKDPWLQIIAGVPTGIGLHMINMQGMNYIADCYGMFTNSASAANTFLRSIFAAVLPYFASQLYAAVGVRQGTTMLALLAASLIPVPVLFYYFGERIRARSKWVPPTCM